MTVERTVAERLKATAPYRWLRGTAPPPPFERGEPVLNGTRVEDIDWYRCVVPDGVVPSNQDGEVEEFRLMAPAELAGRLVAGEFTTEAALILAAAGL